MSAKTIKIELMRRKINRLLTVSVCTVERRWGMIMVFEELLHESGNYKGFGYLTKGEVPFGELPGIDKDSEGKNIFPDETRRYYF